MEFSTLALKKLRKDVYHLVLEAGEKIMEVYNEGFEISEKNDKTPLTTADLASNRIITKGLRLIFPLFPILSEESEKTSFAVRSGWPTYWLIDPLDGTREFINRNGEFTVNIALIHQRKPVIGVVHAPEKDLTYYAGLGQGAFKVDHKKNAKPIHVRPLSSDNPRIVGSRSHATSQLKAYLEQLGDHKLISMGSALKFCLVAEGHADLYPRFGPTSEWDTAAAQCIVEEAGGFITDTHMRPLLYNTKDSFLNPNFFAFGDINRDWSRYITQTVADAHEHMSQI